MPEKVELDGEDETVVFREIQRVRQRRIWGMLAVIGIASLTTVVGPFVALAVGAVIYNIRLTTEVREDGVYVRYAPRHRSSRPILFDDIERCEITDVGSLPRGGPGIIWTPRSVVYSTAKGKGVKLYRKDAKPVTIGTQRADELVAAITEEI